MDTPDPTATDDTQAAAEAVIAQIDGQHDEPAHEAGPDTPPDAPDSPEERTSADKAPEESSFTTFNLADVPEEYRPYVEAAHRSMQADYTRKRQEEAAHRKFFQDRGIDPTDPNAAFQALAQELGYEIDADDPELDPDTPDLPDTLEGFADPLEQRLTALETERAQAAQQQADLASLSEDLDYIRAKLGREPSEQEIDFYGRHAVRDNTGRLGIRDVFDAAETLVTERQQAYRQSKQAPKVGAGGTAGVTARNLDDPEERLKATEEILAKEFSN